MILSRRCRPHLAVATLLTALALGGCGYSPERSLTASTSDQQTAANNVKGASKAKANAKSRSGKVEGDTQNIKFRQGRQIATTQSERECLVRAMYFESQRASREGLIAVGTVVLNRVNSPSFPSTICGVVGQRRQFASGVLSRPMSARDRAHAEAAADELFAGKRHEGIGDAMFFHVATRRYKYPNMRYLQVAGGNIFYRKVGRNAPRVMEGSVLAYADNASTVSESTTTAKAAFETAMTAASSSARKQVASRTSSPEDKAKEAAISAAIMTATTPATRVSFTGPVDEALSRAQSFSNKPLVLGAYRTAKTSSSVR